MAFGARGSARDFGLSSGLVLPALEREHYATSGQAFMPDEKKGRKKEFAVKQDGGSERKRLSIAERIRNWFRKKQKSRSERPVYESNTFPRRPNSAQLATIHEQETENGEGEVQASGDGPNEAVESDSIVRRKKAKENARTKAYSTAFEHVNPPAQAPPTIDNVHLTVRTKSSGPPRKVVLQRSSGEDSFGFHLSGGQPPITITYVKPGSIADKKGIKTGNVLLDLNGINCRKRVEISQLMKMKFMFQQQRRPSTEDQTEKTSAVETRVTVKKENGHKVQEEIGDPLATSSPIKPMESLAETAQTGQALQNEQVNSRSKKSTKKKKSKTNESELKEEGASALVVAESKSDGSQKKSKGKKKRSVQDSNFSDIEQKGNESKTDETPEKKEAKKRKKKRSSIVQENGDNGVVLDKPDTEPIVQIADVEPTPLDEVGNEEENVVAQLENIIDEEELNLHRKDRKRRSTSPKSRYRMDDSDTATEMEADKVASPKKKSKKASTEEDKGKRKKKKVEKSVSEEKDRSGSVAEKKKKKTKSPKKASKKAESKTSEEEKIDPQTETPSPELPILSAAVSGSFESDTMEFVPKQKESSSQAEDKTADESKNSEKKGKKKKKTESYDSNTQSLKREKKKGKSIPQSQSMSGLRRASVDQGVVSSGKHSMSNSQSFSSVEEQNKFRKEASKSEHDLSDVASSMDSSIIVKKSGLVKGKSTSSSRPSIFNQSSSPEPEMTSLTSLSSEREFQQDQSTEDGENIPDPDFKVKKSGKVVGRKTSTGATRPSILDEQSSAAYSDVQPGEMKYHQVVEMDLNAVPQIAPSLGVVAGRDRLDTNNRSLTKRRPPSIRQNSKDNENVAEMGTASRMAAAKKLFENKGDTNSTSTFNGRSFSKSVEKNPKSLGIPSESTTAVTPAKVEDKPEPKPVNAWASRTAKTQSTLAENETQGSVPSWVSKAQGRQQRTSVPDESQNPKNSTKPSSTTNSPPTKDGIPGMGHVAARLAMFQK